MQDVGETNAWVTLQPPFMVVLKAGEHSCRMTHAIIWKGKSHQPERFGIILRLWSLLLRRQGCARACSVFSCVPFSFLSPFLLDCLRMCGLSLPPFSSPSLSHHLSLPPSTRVSGRVGRWRSGIRGGRGGGVGMGVRGDA
jgi:hypothetical protein